jgi:hypothetical protein
MLLCAFVLSACKVYDIKAGIPDAENIFFTDTGRLFVTGGTNIYEIIQETNGEYSKEALTPDGGNFTGMAQVGDYLYALRSSYGFFPESFSTQALLSDPGYLFAYFTNLFLSKELLWMDLRDANRSFHVAGTLNEFLIPNGMVADARGYLYIADSTYLPMGQIVRVKVTHHPDHAVSLERSTWLRRSDGIFSPNGMAIRGEDIYFTDFVAGSLQSGKVRRISIHPVSGAPENLITLHQRAGLFDDLAVCRHKGEDGVAVADFMGGAVVFIADRGSYGFVMDETRKGLFSFPSSVAVGNGLSFDETTLLITEKGIMFDHITNIGNRLSGMDL